MNIRLIALLVAALVLVFLIGSRNSATSGEPQTGVCTGIVEPAAFGNENAGCWGQRSDALQSAIRHPQSAIPKEASP